MRTIIAGSRTVLPDLAEILVRKALAECPWQITSVLHGAAKGIDTAAGIVCAKSWPVTAYPANWDQYGRSAGPRRNRDMARNADAILAIWDGKSPGTGNMIKTAEELGLLVHVYLRTAAEVD